MPSRHVNDEPQDEVSQTDVSSDSSVVLDPVSTSGSIPEIPREERLFSFLTGMKKDLDARVPLYRDDWSCPNSIITVINATIFVFVIQLIPALIFAELLNSQTQGNLATAETLMSTAIVGIIYAIFAGQPLVIIGITGPVAILLGTSYSLAEKFDADYFPFFFWVCIWAGLLHIISATVGLVSLVWMVTPFTSQIFELFISVTFIYASIRDLIQPLYLGQENVQERSEAYATLMLGLLCFYIAWTLHFAETWVYFGRRIRGFLTSYNTLIAVVVVTAISYLPGIDQKSGDDDGSEGIPRVSILVSPWNWQPTADRSWVTNPLGSGIKGTFGAVGRIEANVISAMTGLFLFFV